LREGARKDVGQGEIAMGRWYGTKQNKYSPPSNTALVEAARRPPLSVDQGSSTGDGVSGVVDGGVDVGGESAVEEKILDMMEMLK
jgi:hypothetical protein